MRTLWILMLGACLGCATATRAQAPGFLRLFDGETFTGWDENRALFRIEAGALVGGTLQAPIPHNAFLCTTREFDDFELRLQAKLVGEGDNAGIQFRSRRLPDHHEVSGYQADVGSVPAAVLEVLSDYERGAAVAPDSSLAVWGALYDETRRDRYLARPPLEEIAGVVKPNDWNALTIRAEGPRIQIWLNGHPTVDYTERSHIPRSGVICFQIHSGAPAEAWYREITLRELRAGDD